MSLNVVRKNFFIPKIFSVVLFLSLAGEVWSASVRSNTDEALQNIQTIVIIYAENRSFDNLYGQYPGADGLPNLSRGAYQQKDRNGKILVGLPPVWKTGSDAIDPDYPFELPNAPFRIDAAPVNKGLDKPTRDLWHVFYQNQEQINGGKNDMFAAYSDAGGLAMGYYDGSKLPMYKIAQHYTLADHFFMGAFGGSFLNLFWLICACTPKFPDAPVSMHAALDNDGHLLRKSSSPTSALKGPPQYVHDGQVTPDGYVVNTVQPPYEPSGIKPDNNHPEFAQSLGHPLPPQSMETIGDTLTDKGISWAWYAGGWNRTLRDRSQIYNHQAGSVDFQPHHQPFNYFVRFAPGTKDRQIFLKGGSDFIHDIQHGTLPQVAFFKPQGSVNEHPGYTDILSGDRYIADLIAQLQASPQWKHMAVIVTYDENGGFWDHVSPPSGDRWGPGVRIPAIIVSPYAKKGFVDHTTYDTTSIIKFLTRRFKLKPLPGVRAKVGDLTKAFSF